MKEFSDIHARVLAGLQSADGGTFEIDAWQRPTGEGRLAGEGRTCVLEGGAVFERAGVNFSDVSGPALPPSATQRHPKAAGQPFRAVGVSVVCHPRNPFVPTSHMNVRTIRAGDQWWYGGGFDLTPYLPFEEDAVAWHRAAADACGAFYADFKERCDAYFYLPHRDETRGVGGVFFDDLDATDECLPLVTRIADAYVAAYTAIVAKRKATPFTERERAFQLYRRGRYAEFNLVIDRGTHFGLQSKGRTDSILVSMPPLAAWAYRSPEPELEARLKPFLVPRSYVKA